MKGKFSFILVIIAWLFALGAIACVVAVAFCFHSISPVTDSENEREYELHVPAGMSIREVSQELAEEGLIHSEYAFYYAARFNVFDRSKSFNLKSGVYTVKSSMPLEEIYNLLQTGAAENIKISLPEGLTMSKTARELAEAGICTAEEFIAACHSKELLSLYDVPAESLEGYLFPDTYFFTEGMAVEAVIKMLLDNFTAKVAEIPALKGKTASQLNEVLILASVVEREYRAEDEAPLIASVFANRIAHNIGLQSCATIEYILTEIQGKPHPNRITYSDLEIDNPYNTYKWAGLPPGPICNPGLVALKAAAEPAETDYYFFVLTNPEDGRHTFSTNFEQHRKAENLYTKTVPKK